MAALDNQLLNHLPAEQMTSEFAASLRHSQVTGATLYELFPFGLVYENLEWAVPQQGGPEASGIVTPARETGLRAALR